MDRDKKNNGNGRGTPVSAATAVYAKPAGLVRSLRVTLVLPRMIPAWMSSFLRLASAVDWLEVSVLPVTGARADSVPGLPLDVLAFLAFERLRSRRSSRTLATVPLQPRKGIKIAPDVSADEGFEQLRGCVERLQPDLIVSMGPRPWAMVLAEGARWGCWNIDPVLTDPVRAGTALLAPMLAGKTATELGLELATRTFAPTPLAASWGSTRRGSFRGQRERAFLKLPLLLMRALRRLVAEDPQIPQRQAAEMRQLAPESPLGFGAGVRALAITLECSMRWQLTKRRRPLPWLLVLRQDSESLDPRAPRITTSQVIQAPPGHYWADPCVVDAASRRLVFVEEMPPERKGMIACLELHHGSVTRVGLALEEPSHISYPQVFQWNGEWYMTVESSRQRRVSLYRTSAFPLGWQRCRDLIIDRVCTDPTLHFHDGHWYLFATLAENRNSTWDELFLFVADDLEGPFRPHPGNPIVSDVRRARPAGRLFTHDGRLVRPAQDCAAAYGSAIVFNEVLELSPHRYRERPLSRLAPDWAESLVACHTYSAAGGIELLDARGHAPEGTPRMHVAAAPAAAAVAPTTARAHVRGRRHPVPRGGPADAL